MEAQDKPVDEIPSGQGSTFHVWLPVEARLTSEQSFVRHQRFERIGSYASQENDDTDRR